MRRIGTFRNCDDVKGLLLWGIRIYELQKGNGDVVVPPLATLHIDPCNSKCERGVKEGSKREANKKCGAPNVF
jgi:hypothetical protein